MSDEDTKKPAGADEATGDGESAPETGAAEPTAGASAADEATTAGEGESGDAEADRAAADEGAAAEEAEKAKAEAAAKAKAEAAAKAKAAAEARAAAEAAKPPWERDAEAPEWIEPEGDALADAVAEKFGDRILSAQSFAGDLTFEVATGSIAEVARYLKEEQGYRLLVDLCGADYSDREPRFDVVYQLHEFSEQRRIRLRVKTDEDAAVPTVTGVWRTANWMEREAYDMFGIRFDGHPDMTRILMWEGFNGHPLRKDFPVEGIDTGAAIYPEYYEPTAGPVAGTGTGWMAPKPPAPEPEPEAEAADEPPAGEA